MQKSIVIITFLFPIFLYAMCPCDSFDIFINRISNETDTLLNETYFNNIEECIFCRQKIGIDFLWCNQNFRETLSMYPDLLR